MPPLVSSRRPTTSKPRGLRRHTMTAREIDAFDDIFNMIFSSVAEKRAKQGEGPEVSIGGASKSEFSDLFGKLRSHSKRVAWTEESDTLLDKKKEEIDLCDTDQQLLQWAMREVFGEKRTESKLTATISTADASASAQDPNVDGSTVQVEKSADHPSSAESSSPGVTNASAEAVGPISDQSIIQSPTYPHLIALLMRAFRDRYKDPNLALSIFDHARHLSIVSYVFGCTTAAYNELIETRWRCFRNAQGVLDALVEMSVNGVDFDPKTLKLVEDVRRDVGQKNLREDELDLFGDDNWSILQKIEEVVTEATKMKKPAPEPKKAATPRWNDWKSQRMEDDEDDEWGFDKWDKPPARA
jgi:hypothetical protein